MAFRCLTFYKRYRRQGPLIHTLPVYWRRQKAAIDVAFPSDARQSNRKLRLECLKQMRASEGKKVQLERRSPLFRVLQFDLRPRLQDWKRSTSKYFKFQIFFSE